MPIQLPGQNQPIDYDFISSIVNSLNLLESRVNSGSNNESNLNGEQTTPSNVAFFTKGMGVTIGKNTKTSQDIRFESVSFIKPPIVTATASADVSSTVFLITVTNITAIGCTINIVSSSAPTKEIPATINIIAIGPRK
jgi:hypothetical protein